MPQNGNFRIDSFEDYEREYRASIEDPARFWATHAAHRLRWFQLPDATLDIDIDEPDVSWFSAGRLNVSINCVDRHAQTTPNKVALIWAKNEPGEYERITFRDLKHRVSKIANVLLAHGVKKGDRVCLYMPMMPELVATMLACARIGAVHSVVFAGFSARSLRDRILDANASVVVTANEGWRGTKRLPLKAIVDEAIEGVTSVRTLLVARRTDAEVPMVAGRDAWLDEEMLRQRSTCPAEWMASEDPLFILYTSGSTGKPKGVLHTTAGYLLYASMTHEVVFGVKPDDVFFATADIGWITGHSYLVYGPLANGVTTVLLEAPPNHPDSSRLFRIADDVGATILYTAPTALRSLMGDEKVALSGGTRKSLRVLGTVGEPISPEVWTWYHDVVGEKRCAVVDTWWQTETGGILIAPIAGVTKPKPGSATLPFFGVEPVLLSDDGEVVHGNGVRGNLCLKGSWPGQARTLYGDHRRFGEAYFHRFPGYYFTGDGAQRDEDGYYWITGRVDDVLNVSGHRLGTAEIESAVASHEGVVEAAVVGVPHAIKGEAISAFVVLSDEAKSTGHEQLVGELKQQVRRAIGAVATPEEIHVVPALPKTRSGKIMRRILRALANGERREFGETTTLADPAVVEALVKAMTERDRQASNASEGVKA
jgi:acetyl-CoA synthetase